MANTKSTVKKLTVPKNIRDSLFFKRVGYTFDEEQWKYIEAVWNKQNIAVFADACSGSSKTTIAVGMAMLMAYEFGMYNKIYYIVSPCQEQTLGFMPGSVADKVSMYMDPLKDALATWGYSEKYIESGDNIDDVKEGTAIIKAIPSTYLRGKNISNSFVIVDEMQNATLHDIKKILTRCHDNCKVICIGHSGQIDLKYQDSSGFMKYMNAARKETFIEIVDLTKDYRGVFSRWSDSIN